MRFQVSTFSAFHSLFCGLVCAYALLPVTLHAQQAKLPAPPPAPIVTFTDIAEKAGLTAQNVFGGLDTKKYIIETTGTGVAIFDYDNDGLPDIFLVNAGRLGDGPQPTHFLYHNLGGLKFEDVT